MTPSLRLRVCARQSWAKAGDAADSTTADSARMTKSFVRIAGKFVILPGQTCRKPRQAFLVFGALGLIGEDDPPIVAALDDPAGDVGRGIAAARALDAHVALVERSQERRVAREERDLAAL